MRVSIDVSVEFVLKGVLVAAVLLAASAVPAAAQTSDDVPPSEFDQYVPAVPDSEGDSPIRDVKEDAADPNGTGGAGAIPRRVVDELRSNGLSGEAAADLAEATAPGDEGGGTGRSGEESRGGSSAGAVTTALSGDSDGGLGIVLPLVLLGTVAAGAAFVVLRRRTSLARRSPGPTGDR
jgi:hypothetical protein